MAASPISKATLRAIKKHAPKIDRMARKRYGISGRALLAKLVVGESADDPNAVSSAGARGRTQFMPGTRDIALKKYGIDPWRSADEAVEAAVLHLQGKLTGKKGLEGYNPGDPNYPEYILSRKVGNLNAGAPATVGDNSSARHPRYRTLEQENFIVETDKRAAVLDSLMAGKRGRQGRSLAGDIVERLRSGDYTNMRTEVDKQKIPVTPIDSPPQKGEARRGKVTIPEGALYQGNKLKTYTTEFLDRLAARHGNITVSSGTRVPGGKTVTGNISEHGDGSAADIAAKGKKLKKLMEDAFLELGVSPKKAKRWAEAGGAYNVNYKGKRYQIIGRTNIGGNHWDHLHVGIKPLR